MKRATTILLLAAFFAYGYQNSPAGTISSQVDDIFIRQVKAAKGQLVLLMAALQKHAGQPALQWRFRQARLEYKKAAVLLENFFLAEARMLNGPALPWVEEGQPSLVKPPHGFQVMEEWLYGPWKRPLYDSVAAEAKLMLASLARLENMDGRETIFAPPAVWEAFQKSVLKIMALGITGYDSPVAYQSVPEAGASLQGIAELYKIFSPSIRMADGTLAARLESALAKARAYLASPPNFNAFDRLHFITEHAGPLYTQLVQGAKKAGYQVPDPHYPVHAGAENLFDTGFFNIAFFSPNNDFLPTPERVSLGRLLFYDTLLSGNKTRSCANCHQPEKAFTDGLPKAMALDDKTSLQRNTPTLLYSALQTRLFADSRAGILENQLDEVVHNAQEMGGSLQASVGILAQQENYPQLFAKAYPQERRPLSAYTIANAISSYLRSLSPFSSRFDQYMRGNKAMLSQSEKRGFNLFMGKAKCGTCHFMPLFNGLVPPNFTETESEVLGVPAAGKKKPVLDSDLGKVGFTGSPIHQFAFKTPTLRNIGLTAPYMHNGVFKTLYEVVDFYDKGGGHGLHIASPNQTLPSDNLHLTEKEKKEIVAFMLALEDL